MTPIEILALRRAKGLTQEQFARLLKVGFIAVSRWERGVARPHPGTLERLRAMARKMRVQA